MENNLIPDSLIDIFYKRIEQKLKDGHKIEDRAIQQELNRIIMVNGFIPQKIKDLIK